MYIYIRAMSDEQREIHRDIKSKAAQINQHIIRLALYPKCEYVDHWKHEIWTFLHYVNKLKGRNKLPKPRFIKDALSVSNDMTYGFIRLVEEMESELSPSNMSIKEIDKFINEYQDWLSVMLSANGIVLQKEVKDKLTELMEKYI